ncbi:DUF3422 domain-containing protein [Motiliproteus coralliicola]|uniref:DUF3422 domain-containing protein n=1 Tax=Motiliproteus coralliicola TaxID=2283196 RepID=A0A369WUA6_9GAMM|nr:DUF3422 domain-containing protein [Motiliproteus coralliicola]RDE25252.1 DUF3422 domain-containing protein [Motiliproteus coralliicola]
MSNTPPATQRLETVETAPSFKLGQGPLQPHPLREGLYNELHSRPYRILPSPSQLTHIAIKHGGKDQQRELELLTALCDRYQVTAPTANMPCYHQDFGLFELRWERHTEFSGYTFIRKGELQGMPFAHNAVDLLPPDWLAQLPGTVVAAFHMLIEDVTTKPEPPVEQVAGYFENLRLVGSQPANGKASVWTTFRLHSDGFGRFILYNRGLSESQLGRMAQRFIELETYRLMASLGLPLAREIQPQLESLDDQLEAVMCEIADLDSPEGERELLDRLSSMAAKVEGFRARSNYRFSATKAYHQVVEQRLEVLRELDREVAGHLTLNEFLVRRLTPAVRTCESTGRMLDDLSTRIDRASRLLRTRVQLTLEEQNQGLMSSLDRRGKIQLLMQQTVEGLSVVAISYYLISILKLGFELLDKLGVPINAEMATLASIPLVMLVIWAATRRIHRHFNRLERQPQNSAKTEE